MSNTPDWLEMSLQVLRDVVKKRGLAEEQVRALYMEVVAATVKVTEGPPPPSPPPDGSLACSFCMKSQKEVRKLIAGPSVYICDECIRLCDDIIAEEIESEAEGAARAPAAAGVRFMVVERYRAGNPTAVGARFREKGRMLPPRVEYVASWLSPGGEVCWQLMDAPDRAALDPWLRAWEDLVEFEVTPVLPSEEFWARRG